MVLISLKESKTNDSEGSAPILEMKSITKKFPGVIANSDVDFSIEKGEIHGLLGENGAGKTTLMNILYGLYDSDEGEIFVRGERVRIDSPKDAIDLGIGMVHQHFKLLPPMTVTENIVLGIEEGEGRFFLDEKAAVEKIRKLGEKYGLEVDPTAKILDLSLAEQQRVEILKMLYRDVDILIMDEPTSALAPPEVDQLMDILKSMAEEERSVIFITHKLPQVMRICDRVTILRDGKKVETGNIDRYDKTQLARKMVGRTTLLGIDKPDVSKGEVVLRIEDLEAFKDRGVKALKSIDLTLREGEIVGIAGVGGNGQKELSEVITGIRKVENGKIFIQNKDLTNHSPKEILEQGVRYIPEDRISMGIVPELTPFKNVILREGNIESFESRGLLNFSKVKDYATEIYSKYGIKVPDQDSPTRKLSGGNIQKLILARELENNPKLLVANKPTSGLDVNSAEQVRQMLLDYVEEGNSVLLISENLNELMSVCDRIAVIYEGEIKDIFPIEEADRGTIGRIMSGETGR